MAGLRWLWGGLRVEIFGMDRVADCENGSRTAGAGKFKGFSAVNGWQIAGKGKWLIAGNAGQINHGSGSLVGGELVVLLCIRP